MVHQDSYGNWQQQEDWEVKALEETMDERDARRMRLAATEAVAVELLLDYQEITDNLGFAGKTTLAVITRWLDAEERMVTAARKIRKLRDEIIATERIGLDDDDSLPF